MVPAHLHTSLCLECLGNSFPYHLYLSIDFVFWTDLDSYLPLHFPVLLRRSAVFHCPLAGGRGERCYNGGRAENLESLNSGEIHAAYPIT